MSKTKAEAFPTQVLVPVDRVQFKRYRVAEAVVSYPALAAAGGLSEAQARSALQVFLAGHIESVISEAHGKV